MKWQKNIDIKKLIFLDESGAKTNMTRHRGRAKYGQRLNDATPAGNWSTTTMVSSIDYNGMTDCMVIGGSLNKVVFEKYVEEVLSKRLKPGDIVVMDNLSSHKSVIAKEFIEAKGATVKFLPPYSPDLNPIENMWSKVKEFLRNAKARCANTLYEKIADALCTVSADNAKGWFSHCGYA